MLPTLNNHFMEQHIVITATEPPSPGVGYEKQLSKITLNEAFEDTFFLLRGLCVLVTCQSKTFERKGCNTKLSKIPFPPDPKPYL